MMSALARASSASKRFGPSTAVDSVNLTVDEGEIVGLLGANGAGKTTLIRLLLGLLRPSNGVVSLFGAPPSIATRRRVGYVPQTLGLYPDLTVKDNWSFVAAAFSTRRAPLPESLLSWRDDLAGTLPLGIQRRVAFTVALAHHPKLLVLDEPTSGVGPLAGARLWQDIRDSADHGAGVLVTTHNMDEAEQCDRLVIMATGRVVVSGTIDQITAEQKVTEISSEDWQRAYTALDSRFDVQLHGHRLRVTAAPTAVTELLRSHDIEATVTQTPASLEEAFMAIIAQPAVSG